MKKTKTDESGTSQANEENILNEEYTTPDTIGEGNPGENPSESPADTDRKEQQFADLSDKFLRLAAEYDNFRRRSQKEKEAIYTDSVASIAAAWLPVIDNLERAGFASMEYKHEETKKIREGLDLILQQAKDAMESLGITEIKAKGETFDPNCMEAIMHVEEETAGENEVLEVFKKGYKRGEKIIRHAIVKVAN